MRCCEGWSCWERWLLDEDEVRTRSLSRIREKRVVERLRLHRHQLILLTLTHPYRKVLAQVVTTLSRFDFLVRMVDVVLIENANEIGETPGIESVESESVRRKGNGIVSIVIEMVIIAIGMADETETDTVTVKGIDMIHVSDTTIVTTSVIVITIETVSTSAHVIQSKVVKKKRWTLARIDHGVRVAIRWLNLRL